MLMRRAQNYVLHKVYCDLDEWGLGRRGEYRVGLDPKCHIGLNRRTSRRPSVKCHVGLNPQPSCPIFLPQTSRQTSPNRRTGLPKTLCSISPNRRAGLPKTLCRISPNRRAGLEPASGAGCMALVWILRLRE